MLHEHPLGWTRNAGSKESGDRTAGKTKAGALKQQSGDSFPYGAKYGTGQGYQAQEVPAESTDTFIAGSAPASAIAQARDAAEADILDN